MRVKYWFNRTKESLKNDGMLKTTKRAAGKIRRKLRNEKGIIQKRILRDVLFVNGCDPSLLPHPYRYRVRHQIEQLEAANLSASDILYTKLTPDIVRDFHTIIFYRCPYTVQVGDAIQIAKKLNKRVLFDVDDLVIDTKYTDLIPYVQKLSPEDKKNYDSFVESMGKTLKQCDGAITTTEALANELKNYVPEVFINRNRASEKMFELSEKAIAEKTTERKSITIGYFSGSITHNADFELIKPVLIRILSEFENVQLLLLGELDLPADMYKFKNQITCAPFVDWQKLPFLIASVDINLAPIEETIFNAAKSENKWVEAALVQVPTIASNFGAFKQCIEDGKTGVLCSNDEEWYAALKKLITNSEERLAIGKNAFMYCNEHYNTTCTSSLLANYIRTTRTKHIGFVLPAFAISGGIMVALRHAAYLQAAGWDVDIIAPEKGEPYLKFLAHTFNTVSYTSDCIACHYDVLVATMYFTADVVQQYKNATRKMYLVQNYETDFYPHGEILRANAEKSYFYDGIEYITISRWCQKWLLERYQKGAKYAPNGIELTSFEAHKRDLSKAKIRILVEGDNAVDYKNVDESFKIVEKLDKEKFEVWYMSYNAEPKPWYRVDRFFSKVPYEKVGQVYEQCDILIKSSWLESFSYPPLEMMATGGYCIVVPNGGNAEYLEDEKNCLFYELGDIDAAVQCIERLISDEALQKQIYQNGLTTAKNRDWVSCREQILALYE